MPKGTGMYKLDYPRGLYQYNLKPETIKARLFTKKSGGPYLRHLIRLGQSFRRIQRVIPINWFWWRMAQILGVGIKRGYTTGTEIIKICREKGTWRDRTRFPQQEKTGMMTDFRRMTEAAFKMCHPDQWPLMETDVNGTETGMVDFLLIPTLLAMDALLMDANQTWGGEREPKPKDRASSRALVERMYAAGTKDFYRSFRKSIAAILKGCIQDQIWQEAVGWDRQWGYSHRPCSRERSCTGRCT